MRKVPKLRFKEFSDEWEEKKLGEISEIIMGQSPDSKNYNEKNIGLPLIQGNADCKNRKVYPRLYTSEITKESIPNDIIMTVRAPVGAIAFSNIHSCIGRGVCAIRNTNNFIYHYLIKLENSWEKISQGSTFTAVNSNDIKKLQLILPNIQEQEKIANFLSDIDKKISLTEEKLELFREYKKGVMQKIFSQELRFKDSNGNDYPEWKEKRLGEICIFINGKGHEQFVKENGKYIIVNSKFISSDGKIKKYTDKLLVPLSKNNILMVMSDVPNGKAIGKCYLVEEDNKYSLNQRICSLETKESSRFIYYYLNRNKYFLKFDDGISQTNLKKEEVLACPILLPSLEEQQKIADFLSSIDSKIENIEKELEGLKEFKRGLLQQMFV